MPKIQLKLKNDQNKVLLIQNPQSCQFFSSGPVARSTGPLGNKRVTTFWNFEFCYRLCYSYSFLIKNKQWSRCGYKLDMRLLKSKK